MKGFVDDCSVCGESIRLDDFSKCWGHIDHHGLYFSKSHPAKPAKFWNRLADRLDVMSRFLRRVG